VREELKMQRPTVTVQFDRRTGTLRMVPGGRDARATFQTESFPEGPVDLIRRLT